MSSGFSALVPVRSKENGFKEKEGNDEAPSKLQTNVCLVVLLIFCCMMVEAKAGQKEQKMR